MHSSERLIVANHKSDSYQTMQIVKEEALERIENLDSLRRTSGSPLVEKVSSINILPKTVIVPVNAQPKSGVGSMSKFFRGSSLNASSSNNETTFKTSGVSDFQLRNLVFSHDVKKNFEERERNCQADLRFQCSERNIKVLVDELLFHNSKKKETLEKKMKKLTNLTKADQFQELEKRYQNTFGEFPTFTTENNQNNDEYLREVLRLKEQELEEKKQQISNERKKLFSLRFMEEKRKENVLFFQNKIIKAEKLLEILNAQKGIIDKTSNDLISEQVLSQLTISEFKKDFSANLKFQMSIIERKKALEKDDKNLLNNEINTYLSDSSQIEHYKEMLSLKKQQIIELEERALFLKNARIHVKKESLDYIDRISEIFIYNKPEDFVLDNVLDLSLPLIKKRSQESQESIATRNNFKPKNQMLFKKLSGFQNPPFTNLSLKSPQNLKSIMNIPSMNIISKSPSVVNFPKDEVKKSKDAEKESVIMRINDFYFKHQNDIPDLANKIIQEFTKLTFEEESANNNFFDLTEQLRKHKKTYLKVLDTLNDLLKQNENAEFITDPQNASVLRSEITRTRSRANLVEEQHPTPVFKDDEISTILGLKLEINNFQIDQTTEYIESQKIQFFIFQSFLFFEENMLRILAILTTISKKIEDDGRLALFVVNIFENMNETYKDIVRNDIYLHVREVLADKTARSTSKILTMSQDEPPPDNQSKFKDFDPRAATQKLKKMKHQFELHAKFKEMQKDFLDFFPDFKNVFQEFLEMLQNDVVLYNFFTEKKFHGMLQGLEVKLKEKIKIPNNILKTNVFTNLFFDEVFKFKQISYQLFQFELEKILKNYEKLFKDLNEDKKKLKEKNQQLAKNYTSAKRFIYKQSTLEPLEENDDFRVKVQKMPPRHVFKARKSILKEARSSKKNELAELELEEKNEQEYFSKNRREIKEKYSTKDNSNTQQMNAKQSLIEAEGPQENDLRLRELKQFKELTRYRFNLDHKLFEMKQERKKLISKSPDHMDTAFYLRTGMSFFPRTTFYNNENPANTTDHDTKNIQIFVEKGKKVIPLRAAKTPQTGDGKIHIINTNILRPYSRSLSPIIRRREKIQYEGMNMRQKYEKNDERL